jgi:hypothetical protein
MSVRLPAQLVLCLPLVLTGQDAREIVRQSIELDHGNTDMVRKYTFLRREEIREYEANGKFKKAESTTQDVTPVEGSPYKRLVARNDQPLSAKDQAKEDEKLRRSIEDRRKETADQRAARIADWQRSQNKQREPLKEMPDAFDLKMAGEEEVDGVDTWIIDGMPKAGYKPKSSAASIFAKVKIRLWIDKELHQWVRLELDSLDTISFGGILLRLAKGSHVELQNVRVNNEVWLPKLIALKGSMRIALIRNFHGEVIINYSGYKKFQAESRVIAVGQ